MSIIGRQVQKTLFYNNIKMKQGGPGRGKTTFICTYVQEKLQEGEDVVLALLSNAGRLDILQEVLLWDLAAMGAHVVMVGIPADDIGSDDKENLTISPCVCRSVF